MTRSKPYLWPVGATLHFYNGRKHMLRRSKDRRLDLSDTLMLRWDKASRTVYLAMCCKGRPDSCWDEEQVNRIERQIRYDLGFDGYGVTIARMRPLNVLPLEAEFIWRLRIRTR